MPKPREVMGWYEYFVSMATLVAKKSKDPSTQVGAVVVGPDMEVRTTGFNGFPRGVCDNIEQRWERPAKYDFVTHAEENCVMQAARIGVSLKDCTMYLNSFAYPCARCTNAVIQSGIKFVVGMNKKFAGVGDENLSWSESCEISKVKLIEAGIIVILLNERYQIDSVKGIAMSVPNDSYHHDNIWDALSKWKVLLRR